MAESNKINRLSDFGAIINEIKIKLPSYSVNESAARAMVSAFCAQLDPAAVEIADVKCAVSEAVTNCIVHAYKNMDGIMLNIISYLLIY